MARTIRHSAPSGARRPRLSPPPSLAGRSPCLLAVAVAGALLTSSWPEQGAATTSQSVIAAQLANGRGGGPNFAEVTNPRRDAALMAAAARLDDVRASRAAREAEEAEEAERRTLPLKGVLTTSFAMRWGEMHWGIDIAAPMMTPEYAAAAGTVLRAGPASG